MAKYNKLRKKIEWPFYSSEIPSGITTNHNLTGSVKAFPLEYGGYIQLLGTANGGEARIILPSVSPQNWSEIRFKALIKISDITNSYTSFLLSNTDASNSVSIENGTTGFCATRRINGNKIVTNTQTKTSAQVAIDFEIIWKKGDCVEYYVDNRMVARTKVFPADTVVLKPQILFINRSDSEKENRVYNVSIDMFG